VWPEAARFFAVCGRFGALLGGGEEAYGMSKVGQNQHTYIYG